jgi:hypothetical protein
MGGVKGIRIMQPQPNDNDLLDSLCHLRELYAGQGYLDRDVALSVNAAVVYGEGLLRIGRRRDEHAARRDPTPSD